jgi:hypothetical protein
MLPDKVYNVLKWIVMIVLPASSTLYVLLANTWGLPFGDQISATITGIATFLGAIIGISSRKYNKSNMTEVIEDTTETIE